MSTLELLRTKVFPGLALTMLLATAVSAQTITGTISGTVVDPNGGIIPGASVTLIFAQTGTTRNTSTNAEGRFSFAALQPGVYTVKVEHQGFQTLMRQNTIL